MYNDFVLYLHSYHICDNITSSRLHNQFLFKHTCSYDLRTFSLCSSLFSCFSCYEDYDADDADDDDDDDDDYPYY